MPEREAELMRVAEAITDDQPVAWEAEKAAHPTLSESLEVLQQLDLMARAHSDSDPTVEFERPAGLGTWGHLRIVERIGEGGFGEVFRAHDPMLRVDVALKLLRESRTADAKAEEEFLEEARRLARIRHPHVLVVHGADRHDGRAGIWTELLEGQTLEALMKRQGRLGHREAAVIGLDLCSALAAIHAAGLLHRDVKTENVIRASGGRIVLMDLGCGAEMSRVQGHQSATIRGTPLTMAPEQLEGRTAGPPTDVYGLSILLYRLVTSSYPIEAATLGELIRKRTSGESVGLRDRRPDLPAGFVTVIEKGSHSDPARRYQTAGEMERALSESMGVSVAVPDPHRRRPRFPYGWVLAPAAVLLVFVLVNMAGLWPPGRENQAGVAPVTPASVAPLTLKADLFRYRAQAQERLEAGSTIGPGDGLFLEVEGSDSCYVYVLNEDLQGRTFVLFPAPGLETHNPLAGDKRHRLPGTREGKGVSWQVTSAGGEERIVVVASRSPLDSLERQIAALPTPQEGAPVSYSELNLGSRTALYRAVGGYTEGPANPAAPPAGRLDELVAKLSPTQRPDLAVWFIQLENPGK